MDEVLIFNPHDHFEEIHQFIKGLPEYTPYVTLGTMILKGKYIKHIRIIVHLTSESPMQILDKAIKICKDRCARLIGFDCNRDLTYFKDKLETNKIPSEFELNSKGEILLFE